MADNQSTGETALDYEIVNSYWTCGEGNINSIIKDEGGFWKSYIGTDRVKVKCKLKLVCRSVRAQFRIANVNMIELTTLFKQEEISNQMEFIKPKENQSKLIIKHQFKQADKDLDQIQLDLHSHNKKQIQIYSLKFYGIALRKKVIENNQNSIKAINFQVFEERQKKKAESFKKYAKNKQKQSKSKEEDKKQDDEDIQVKKQEKQRRQNKNKQLSIVVPEGFDENDLMEVQEQIKQGCYKKINLDEENLQDVMDVTIQWLEAQKKLQASFGVRIQDRLSVKINPRCFTNTKFCLPNIYGDQKSKYVRMIKQLGGLIREQLQQGCIVATSRPKGRQVGIARLMVGVTIVKLRYIDQCYQLKTKLSTHKYVFDPLDFIAA